MNYIELRNRLNLTQIEMSKKLGVSLSTWRMWEKGVTKPNNDNLNKIKLIFNSSPIKEKAIESVDFLMLAEKIKNSNFFVCGIGHFDLDINETSLFLKALLSKSPDIELNNLYLKFSDYLLGSE